MNRIPSYLFACLLLLPLAGWSAVADGLLLSGFESPGEWVLEGRKTTEPFTLETSPAKVKEGRSSAKWSQLDYNKWTRLAKVPADWSAYEAVSLWIYAEKANGQQINFSVGSPSPESEQGYYLYSVKVDWTGWQQLVVPFSRFKSPRKTAGWSKIASFKITAGGWGAEPLPDTVLYLDDLRLLRR